MYSDFGSKPLTGTVLITSHIVFMAFVKFDGDTRYPGDLAPVNRVVPNKVTKLYGLWKLPELREATSTVSR